MGRSAPFDPAAVARTGRLFSVVIADAASTRHAAVRKAKPRSTRCSAKQFPAGECAQSAANAAFEATRQGGRVLHFVTVVSASAPTDASGDARCQERTSGGE